MIGSEWLSLITGSLSGGTVVYLIVDKMFSRKKDSAEAHGSMVVSFDKEMEALRRIRLDMIEDVNSMREKAREEREKLTNSISSEVAQLKRQLIESQEESQKREELFMGQLLKLGATVKSQAAQINKMIKCWQLLCDVECESRHVPVCPIKSIDDEED